MIDFHELYEQYAPDVYRFAFWLSGNSMDADDITSETFVRAWTSRSKIRTETLKGYLLTIARNFYLEQQRKGKRQVALEPYYPDPRPGPERSTSAQLEFEAVWQQLQQLSEVDRTAFILRMQYELPYAEIARVMGISLSAAKVKIHRVRLKLAAERSYNEETES